MDRPTTFNSFGVLIEEKEGGRKKRETKLCGVGVGRMKEESGGRSVEEAAYGCRKSTAGGSISI